MDKSGPICFIGGGNMARAIIAGAVQKEFKAHEIVVLDHNQEKCNVFEQEWHIMASTDPKKVFALSPQLFVLAVKPQDFKATIDKFELILNQTEVGVVSLAPGLTMLALTKRLPRCQWIRAMPNTPATVHAGATVLFAKQNLPQWLQTRIDALFSAIGITTWVESEHQFNVFTALSGCGPAYYFYFLEIFIAKARELGLAQDVAQTFAVQTIQGAAQMAKQSRASIATLRANVTSKGGVTAKALDSMQQDGIESLIADAMDAALKRIDELEQTCVL